VTEGEIYDALQDIFNTVFRRTNIALSPQLTARDVPGWDSFKHVSMIIAAENRFGIKFLGSDLDAIRNVGDLATAIARHRAGTAVRGSD
jgi:acyl carrier protein